MAYNIPTNSIGFWRDYLQNRGIAVEPVEERFGMEILPFDDPDGMRIELVASDVLPPVPHWEEGSIPQVHAPHGFRSVTLWLEEVEPTADLLIDVMGYTLAGQEGNRYRFPGVSESLARTLAILYRPVQPEDMPDEAVFGAGSIHHIVFRVPTDEEQLEYQSSLRKAGYDVTPVRDRAYFHSIYYP